MKNNIIDLLLVVALIVLVGGFYFWIQDVHAQNQEFMNNLCKEVPSFEYEYAHRVSDDMIAIGCINKDGTRRIIYRKNTK